MILVIILVGSAVAVAERLRDGGVIDVLHLHGDVGLGGPDGGDAGAPPSLLGRHPDQSCS